VSAAPHPVGYRPAPAHPTWLRAFGGVVAGYLVAALLTGIAAGLLSRAGLATYGWSVGRALAVLIGAALCAVCVRQLVERTSWHTVSWRTVLLFGLALSPGWALYPRGASFSPALPAIVLLALLVRYRSPLDARSLPSVGYRLQSRRELDKIVSHH
jgi:hypothetical protein